MQTVPTHAVGGLAVSQVLITLGVISTSSLPPYILVPLFWIIGIAGAIAPDVPYALYYVWYDKVLKVPPAVYAHKQGLLIKVAKELSHSLPAWIVMLGLVALLIPDGIVQDLARTFVLAGLVAGVLPDIPSHSEERYKADDCGFLWPLPWRIRWPNTKWEYRKAHSDFSLKPWERKLAHTLAYAWLALFALHIFFLVV